MCVISKLLMKLGMIAYFIWIPTSPSGEAGRGVDGYCIGRAKSLTKRHDHHKKPVAYLVCNQTPPVDGKPSLMSFSEVETYSRVWSRFTSHADCRLPRAAGINNVEWDAVELPPVMETGAIIAKLCWVWQSITKPVRPGIITQAVGCTQL